MLKLIGLHLGRTFTRIFAALFFIPVAIGEVGMGLWIYDGIGHDPIGKILAATFIGGGVLAILLLHYIGREIDGWKLHNLDRIHLRQSLRGRPRLRAFATNFA